MYTHIPVTVMKAGLAFHVKMVKAVIIIRLVSFFKFITVLIRFAGV